MQKVNNTNFKKAMGKFATGVTVITINYKKTYIGKTVNSFSSLSLNPPLVLFSLDKKSSSLKKYKISKYIGINFLTNKQKKLSNYFANKKNSCEIKNYYLSKNHIPMINESLVNLNCKKIQTLSIGDHIVFVCKILELKFNHLEKPLIYLNKKYY